MTTQTIEQTGKKYKAMTAIAWAMILIPAPILFIVGCPIAAVVTIVVSVLLGAYAELGAWWNHG